MLWPLTALPPEFLMEPVGTVVSFLIFSVGMSLVIGLLASQKSQKSELDYFLGGQNISPYFLALSASASKYSGFVFVGLMALAFEKGTASIWFCAGMLLGDLAVRWYAVKQLQDMNSGGWALSVAELLTFWNGEDRVWLRRFVGAVTFFFLAIYAAAQLKAGGRILQVALDQPLPVGVFLSTAVIAFYCWSGGIRASIWTDVAQVTVMSLSIGIILVVAVQSFGGIWETFARFMETAPSGSDEVKLFPQNLSVGNWSGWILFFVGAMGTGACVLGQPHVLIRPMALKKPSDVKKYILTTYIFEVLFTILLVLVGLCTRIVLQGEGPIDGENALFLTALKILSPVVLGFFLAGAFSSSLSTADSQILCCSASLLRDFPRRPKESLILAKVATISIVFVAAAIALFAKKSVFSLVIFAYSGLGVSIGSLLIMRMLRSTISERGALAVSLTGGIGLVCWEVLGLNTYISASVPGFILSFLVYVAVMTAVKFFPFHR